MMTASPDQFLATVVTPSVFVPDPSVAGFDFPTYCRETCAETPERGDVFLDLRHITFMGAADIIAVLKLRAHFLGQSKGFYVLNPSPVVVSCLKNARLDRVIETAA
jgi:anti-anti-sigma regulatory factor